MWRRAQTHLLPSCSPTPLASLPSSKRPRRPVPPDETITIWLTGDVVAHLRRIERDVEGTALTGEHLVDTLAAMVDARGVVVVGGQGRTHRHHRGEGTPREIARERDLMQMSDVGAIKETVDAVLDANAGTVAEVQTGT